MLLHEAISGRLERNTGGLGGINTIRYVGLLPSGRSEPQEVVIETPFERNTSAAAKKLKQFLVFNCVNQQ